MSTDIIRIAERGLEAVGAGGGLAERALRRTDRAATASGEGWRDARVLRFDDGRTIGRVDEMVGPAETVTYPSFGLATGDVAVPAGTRVLLALDAGDEAAWQMVSELAPGSIQGLVAVGPGTGPHHRSVLRSISHLTDLQELSITDAHVDLRDLRHLEHLVDLKFERCSIEDGNTAADLAHLTLLEELRLIDTALNLTGFAPPACLRLVDITANAADDDPVGRLAGCPALHDLRLRGDLSSFHFLAHLPNLRDLEVNSPAFTDVEFAHLHADARLIRFDGCRTKVGDGTMQRLADHASLEGLMVDRTRVTDAGIRSVRGLTNLRTLWFAFTEVTGASLQSLRRMRLLESLHITSIGASDEDMAPLEALSKLCYLYAGCNDLTDDLADACPRLLRRLRQCFLNQSLIGPRVVRELGHAPRLVKLNIDGCPNVRSLAPVLARGVIEELDARGCDQLSQVPGLSRCSSLRRLDLSATRVSPSALRLLHKLTQLRTLALEDTFVTDAVLAGQLASLPLLEHLDLDHTRITDATLHQLVEHPSLQVLCLQSTAVTSAGIAAVATCPHLDTLLAAHTLVDDTVVGALHALTRREPEPTDAPTAGVPARGASPRPGAGSGAALAVQDDRSARAVAIRIDEQLAQLGIPRPQAPNASRLTTLDLSGTDVTAAALLTLRTHPLLETVYVDAAQLEAMPTRHEDGIEGTCIEWRLR